jgi:hypothetical protein
VPSCLLERRRMLQIRQEFADKREDHAFLV